jgi:hypothetical protein
VLGSYFSEGTILHEALHNLTGMDDTTLAAALWPPSGVGKNRITQRLIEVGCAVK